MGNWPLIAVYLGAIVVANLTVALASDAWRPTVVLVNGLVLIALDLTSRDRLHEAWAGRGLFWRMGALILIGSLLSYSVNGAAGPVALASCAAFAAAALADAGVYHLLHGRSWLVKANGSNAVSGLVDSAAFLCGIAYAGMLPWALVPALVGAQWAAKIIGGALWSWVLRGKR